MTRRFSYTVHLFLYFIRMSLYIIVPLFECATDNQYLNTAYTRTLLLIIIFRIIYALNALLCLKIENDYNITKTYSAGVVFIRKVVPNFIRWWFLPYTYYFRTATDRCTRGFRLSTWWVWPRKLKIRYSDRTSVGVIYASSALLNSRRSPGTLCSALHVIRRDLRCDCILIRFQRNFRTEIRFDFKEKYTFSQLRRVRRGDTSL